MCTSVALSSHQLFALKLSSVAKTQIQQTVLTAWTQNWFTHQRFKLSKKPRPDSCVTVAFVCPNLLLPLRNPFFVYGLWEYIAEFLRLSSRFWFGRRTTPSYDPPSIARSPPCDSQQQQPAHFSQDIILWVFHMKQAAFLPVCMKTMTAAVRKSQRVPGDMGFKEI